MQSARTEIKKRGCFPQVQSLHWSRSTRAPPRRSVRRKARRGADGAIKSENDPELRQKEIVRAESNYSISIAFTTEREATPHVGAPLHPRARYPSPYRPFDRPIETILLKGIGAEGGAPPRRGGERGGKGRGEEEEEEKKKRDRRNREKISRRELTRQRVKRVRK